MLFRKENKKKVNLLWSIICVVLAFSMILLYIPGFL